jgi:cyclophilin family peptidyl-prolyl cis-trans isomerase
LPKKKTCPFCGSEVNKENFQRHLFKVHGDLDKSEFSREGLKKPTEPGGKKSKKKGKREAKRGNKLPNTGRNIAIAAFILIIVAILVVAVISQNLNQNNEPENETTTNGNGTTTKPIAVMTLTMGTTTETIKIELDTVNAPVTAGNFIDLANSGFYNGLIFHRVKPDFVIQGGGYTSDGSHKSADTIPWENTGLSNSADTIAMARSGDPDSEADSDTASSQFFINTVDNPGLDSYTYRFVVFGRVVEGFNVVDSIEALPTSTNNGMEDWPDDPPVITSVVILE